MDLHLVPSSLASRLALSASRSAIMISVTSSQQARSRTAKPHMSPAPPSAMTLMLLLYRVPMGAVRQTGECGAGTSVDLGHAPGSLDLPVVPAVLVLLQAGLDEASGNGYPPLHPVQVARVRVEGERLVARLPRPDAQHVLGQQRRHSGRPRVAQRREVRVGPPVL